MYLLFVGEERSNLAKQRGVRWQDEALAAVPLFHALRSCGIDPQTQCQFVNLFECGGITTILKARREGLVIVGMGQKVQRDLTRRKIRHLALVHPAARGLIRKRERYIAHVKEVLSNRGCMSPAGGGSCSGSGSGFDSGGGGW